MQNTCSQDSKQNCFKFHMFHGHERQDDTMSNPNWWLIMIVSGYSVVEGNFYQILPNWMRKSRHFLQASNEVI